MTMNPLQIDDQIGPIGTTLNVLVEEGVIRQAVVEPIGAAQIAFTPVPDDWNDPPPETLEDAADQLAARAPVQFAAGALGPLATLSFSTPPITPVKSGRFLVIGFVSASTSSPSQQTTHLLADATEIGSALSGTSTAGNAAGGTVFAVAALDKATDHTFTLNITTTAGTLATLAGRVRILVLEF